MKQAASLKDFTPDTLLPGVKINTSATDFYPIEQLQMMRFKDEKWDLFGDRSSAAKSAARLAASTALVNQASVISDLDIRLTTK